MDVGVYVGSPEAYCGEGRGERVVCARGKVWHGSGGGHELAHSRKSDQTIASSTARAGSALGFEAQASGRMYMECGECVQVMNGGCTRNETMGNE